MGEPEGIAQFERFQAHDLDISVARPLLETLEPESTQMPFYITGYGRFWLACDTPWVPKPDPGE